MLALPTPAQAAYATSFTITNAASYRIPPVPRELLTIFTDAPATGDVARVFSPWESGSAPGGLWVDASCAGYDQPVHLPLLYVGPIQYDATHSGTQLNVFYPNSNDPQKCADSGLSRIRIQPATGYGTLITQDVLTVPSRPGVFFAGDRTAPIGDYVNPATDVSTSTLTAGAADQGASMDCDGVSRTLPC